MLLLCKAALDCALPSVVLVSLSSGALAWSVAVELTVAVTGDSLACGSRAALVPDFSMTGGRPPIIRSEEREENLPAQLSAHKEGEG